MGKKTFKRAVSLVIALMMILSVMQVSFAVTRPEDDILLYKTATLDEDEENTYKIQLSVKGKDINTGKKVDVILVIDNSASMFTSKYNSQTLGKITEEAAKAFVEGVLTPANDISGNVRVAIVRYGEQANARNFTDSGSWSDNWSNSLDLKNQAVYTSDKAAANKAVEEATKPTTNEGTNTEGGFLMARKVAEASRSEAENIVVFMTDGMPTFRYTGSGSNTTNDTSGSSTSRNELNEAIDAALGLKADIGEGGEIYTVALLNNVKSTSNQAKLAANLLSKNLKKSDRSSNTSSIMSDVNTPSRWTSVSPSYVTDYYSIHAGDDAAAMMYNIYKTIAGGINALANGYVTDVIPENFELTEESLEFLESKGVVITENGDGTTTLVFEGVKANEAINYLHAYKVKAKEGVYGTGFTNEEAYYTFTLFGNTEESEPKLFPQPVVAINPTAANDDGYSVFQGEILTVKPVYSVLKNDETLKLDDGDYEVSALKVADDFVKEITTAKGGKAVLKADGTFIYTPPVDFVGTDSFTYKNMTKVEYIGEETDESGLAGDYYSNEATVKILVEPVEGERIAYTVEHKVQESNEILATDGGFGYANEEITVYAKEFINYVLAPEEFAEKTLTINAEGDNKVVFWYVAKTEPVDEIEYTVRYLDKATEEELAEDKIHSGYPGDEITEYAIDIEDYTPEEEEQTFVLDDEGIIITFWYEKDTSPKYYVTINHHTRTGSGSYSLNSTDENIKLSNVTTGSTIYGEDYKKASLISSNYTFDKSTPVSQVITGSAFNYTFDLYYTKTSSPGPGPGPGPGPKPNPSPGPTVIDDNPVPLAELEKIDHFAYIIGYPEGDIRPLNKITREEVAMIFYRLLTDESREALLSDSNQFTDVESGRWSNRAISTLVNADIISGYPDGTFRPAAPITRAEFATIAAKFDDLDLGSASKFTDIVGHWAEQYITSSENKGWIKGYPDMTFRPQQDITRAEAMTLINNVLGRKVPAENIHPDAIFWPDIKVGDWFYEAVMEATNSHDYIYEEDGDELWTGMKANKVWQ